MADVELVWADGRGPAQVVFGNVVSFFDLARVDDGTWSLTHRGNPRESSLWPTRKLALAEAVRLAEVAWQRRREQVRRMHRRHAEAAQHELFPTPR